MDFLDPQKQRLHRRRLLVGYALTIIAVALAATWLAWWAYGYGIDTKTGQVIQNGLLFVDSKPRNAQVYLNGKPANKNTSARIVLPSGNYELDLKRPGYYDWTRSFTLTEHMVSRFIYPVLIPTKPVAKPIKNYAALPGLATQSDNQKWLLVQQPEKITRVSFDQYDLGNTKKAPRSIAVPVNLVTVSSGGIGKISALEWSRDSRTVLLKHTYGGGQEFIVFNRDQPANSFNVDQTFNIALSDVHMRDGQVKQLYLLDNTGALRLGDVKNKTKKIVVSQVRLFRNYSDNTLIYVTATGAPTGKVQVKAVLDNQKYDLATLPAKAKPLVSVTSLEGERYIVIGSDLSGGVNIYKNALQNLVGKKIKQPTPILSLRLDKPQEMFFSKNSRFVSLRSGSDYAVYDFEAGDRYHFSIKDASTPARWLDGHRFVALSKSKILVSDFDSTNKHTVVPSMSNQIFITPNSQQLLVFAAGKNPAVQLQSVSLLTAADL